MKKSFITSLVIGGLVLASANSVFANAIVTNPANTDVSADLAAVGGSGGYLTTSIALQELNNRDITNGTIILTISTNFQFNTAATVSASVSRGSGTGGLVGLNSGTAIVTTSNITVTVTNQDAAGSTTSRITWSNVQLRPLLGTPLATNNITMATNSTANILGITKGVTSFGQLREVVGAVNKLGYTTAPAATNTAGVALTNVVVQVQDQFGNAISSNNVAIGLTLNTGTFASGNTNATTGAGGSATLSNLVINTAGNYTLTASAAATSLSNSTAAAFTVVAAVPSTLQILQDAPTSIFTGVTFPSNVTVLVTDAFANPVSNKTVTLSLLSGAPLSGTTSQPSGGNGIATFSGLSVAQAGSQTLVASSSSPSLSTTGTAFTVNAGFASQLGYTLAPAATTTAGVTMASIVVQIQDQAGNPIASNGVPITVTLNAGGFTSGTTTINTAPNGSATFGDLVINTSGHYTLTASAASTTFTSTAAAPFTIAPATPSVIQITQDAPSSTTAGTTFSPAVTVLITDSLNNPITNTTVTLSLLGGGTLNGTVSQPTAVNGVATFANLNITVPGASYALVANSVNSLSVTGNTFAVTAAAASKLVYTSVPATTNTAGSTLSSFTVQITDPFGNAISTNGVPITMSLNNGTFASGTTPVNSTAGGSATFGDLVITNAGNNTLTASATGLTSANTPLTILPGTFAMTLQQDAPSPATAGVTFSPPVAVRIADQFNNPLTSKTVTLTLLGGGTLNGTLSQATAANGVASFNNLSINAVGTNYSLVASSSSPSLTVTGATFTVNAATASKLVFTSVPPAITNIAGSQLSSFGIQIQDAFNNNILTNGVLITMTLSNGTFASGTTSTNSDVNGSASVGDLVITNAGNNAVTASASGLTSASKALVILPAPYAITFQQDAPAVTNAGAVFTPAVAVKIADQYNNVLSGRTVTLSLLNGAGLLNGTTSQVTAVTGVASFNNLAINVAGTNYALVAATNSLATLSVTGNIFTVTSAAATKLGFTGVPANTVTAGVQLASFVMQVQDQFSNPVATNGVQISMTLSNGTFFSGTTSTNTDVNGSVTVGDLVITNAGNNRVTASAAGLTSTNKTLVIAAAQFAMTFQQDAPAVTNAGAVFTPPVAIRIADQFSNFLGNASVTLSLLNGGTFNATGTRTTATTNGVAVFTGLNITVPGSNYTLVANVSSPALSATGQTFIVTVGAPSKLMYTLLPPSTAVAGLPFSAFIVQIEDAFNNSISTSNVPITLTLNTGSFGGGTTNTVSDGDGSKTFGDVFINNIGTYTMAANSPGLSSAFRVIFVSPTNASNIAFIQQPPAVTNAGAVFSPAVTVKITDQYTNAVAGLPVILSLNGGGTLNGTTSQVTSASGVATFSNLSVNQPGTNDSLTAITTNPVLSATSSNFVVNTGVLNHYLVTTNSSPQTRGTPFGITVTAQDAVNNTVPDSSTVVTLSGSTANVLFDGSGDNSYTNNTHVLSNGSFTINALDNFSEGITITAKDASNRTGSVSLTVNGATGDYRSFQTGPWNNTNTWQTWNGSGWVTPSTPPSGTAGINITILSTHTVTDNVAVALSGTLIVQGTTTFSGTGAITVGSGGVVLNSGTINNASATTLIFNAGSTYLHAENGGTIPAAAYNANSLLEVTGLTTTIATLPTNGVNGSVEWNCPNQTVVGGIIIATAASSQSIGGDFDVVSTGTGSIIDGGTSARNLIVGGNMNVQGGAYYAIGGNGSSAGNVSVSVASNLTVSGGNFTMVVGQGTTSAFNVSGALTVGGNLALTGGTLAILTNTTYAFSGVSSMTVSGNTSIAGGLLNLTVATSGNAAGVTANLKGDLVITGGTISRAGSLPATVNFAGTSPETYSKSAGTISGAVNFAILSGATVNFGTSFLDGSSGTFALNAGGTIGVGDPLGITTSGASGNIRVSGTRTYSTGASYVYNGPASQVTSNGLPATVSSLTVSNTGGIVALGSNVSVTSNLTVSAGAFDLGGFTANRASNGGTVTVANGATLKIGGTNTFPTNYLNRVLVGGTVEYEGSSQSVAALPYGTLNTSGSSNKTLLAGVTTIAGDMNIGVGTTFNAVTNSFSIAGNLTNNGTAFAFSGPQTVTFTGSGTQNVSGASATAFNTFAIGSNTVIELDDNDTALEFTIAGLDQAGGTWGSTASNPDNTNDTNFVGLGTLAVTPPTFGIAITQDAPSVTNAGAVFSPAVTVQLSSSATNLIVNKTVTLTLNGGGTLGGTTSVLTDTNGLATFGNLFINAAGTNYSLTASISNPSLSVTGNTFVVTSGSATKLAYTTVPATNTYIAGSTISNFVVQVEDSLGNPVATNGVPITMSLSSGAFASGTTTLFTGPDGSALSTDLVVTNAVNNNVIASAAGLTSASKAFVILPAPYAITFQQDAPAVTNAGAVFTPSVAVKIADQYNNVLSNKSVVLTLLNGGTLNATTTRSTISNGVATFPGLFITIPGTNYNLVATITSPSLSVTGNTFVVTTAPATKLIYPTLPPASVVAGATLTPFTVQIADQFNNSIATNGVPITMTLSNSAFASGTTLSNSDVNGSAGFGDLVITNAGNRILVASAPGLTSTNRAIIVTPDAANSTIAFVQGPPSPSVGAAVLFTNTVKIVDEFNNGISNATVTLAPINFAALSGTVSRATAGNGVVTFTNLSVSVVGSNYFITATSGSLSTTSSAFNVTAGPIAHYVVTATTPQTRDVNFNVTVTAVDAVGNTVPDNSTVVTMSGSTVNVEFDGTGDNSFTNNTHVLSNGTFIISTEDDLAETITVTASDASGKTGTSSGITINSAGGDYRSATNGNWSVAATWQVWNGASWVSTNVPPAGGAGTNITVQSTHTVTNNTAIGLAGALITQGSLTFSAGGSITVTSGGLVQNSGVITNSSASTLIFGAGGTYQHDFTTTAGTIPNAAWNTNSTCAVIGYTTLDNSGGTPVVPGLTQPFGNFTWNCLSQSGTITTIGALNTVNGNFTLASSGTGFLRLGNNSIGDLTIGGNYSQTAGNFQIAVASNRTATVSGNFTLSGGTFDLTAGIGHGKLNVAGNFSHTGGTLTESQATSPVANVVFDGTGIQNYTSGGTVSGTVNYNVSNNATLFLGTNFLGSGSAGTFTLSASGTLGIGDPLGITTSGASGNVRVTGTRTYNTGANYIYNGPASQVTSNGLPATVTSLTVSNTGGVVTLGSNVSITSNLTVSAGTFDLGGFTANRATSGGTITVANGAALNIGGTNPFPSNYTTRNLGVGSTVQYEGSAQNVAALPYGSLATSGSGIKTLLAGSTTIASNLTIGAGSTFAAGTNSFSIAGNWSNNGNGFTATNAQTVSFIGASPQTIDGAFATAFNNVVINSGSVLNLAINGSSCQLLTIAGVNQTAGTYGATGSGASNIDNVDFQGTGTLNVLTALTSPSTTTIASSSNPSTYGQSVTFTANVTSTGPTPTGTVTFMAGANSLGTQTLSGSPTGTAAVVTSGLFPGSYAITAVYSGDANSLASSNSLSQQVNLGPLTITANSTTKTYGQTVSFAGTEFTATGLTNGDTVSSVTLSSDGTVANAAAGNHSIIPSAAVGTGLTNYTIAYQNGVLTVNQAPVTGSITATNKVYDGTVTATISSYSLGGGLFGDDVSLTGGTATFSDKNVANNKTVTATGLSLTGAMANDYVLTSSNASTTANITPAALTVSADNKSRPYGQPNPPLTASYSGFGSGDDTNVLSGTPSLTTTADTNSPVASYPINITAGSLSAANYTFAVTNGTLTVGQAVLTVTADNKSRPYGATNPVFTATFTGFFNGDTTNVISGAPAFSTTADTNSTVAGNPYTIAVTNGTLVATNYNFAFVNGQLTVAPATVNGSITASNKVYDGTTAASIASYALSGVIGTDDVTLTGGTANFSDSNVGTGKLVTVTGLALSGTTTGNYALASSTTNTTANITAYPITVTAATNTKFYDGTNTASASPTITAGTLQNTDTATFSETYDNKNVGIGKTLTPTATIFDGNGGTNYFVAFVNNTTGVITNLTLTGSITASNKVYDGTTAATISSYSLTGVIGLDDVHLTGGTANFNDKTVATGKSVIATGLTLSGSAAGNYTVNTTASTTADITPAALTIDADNKTKTAGLPNPILTATYVGFVGGDDTNALSTQAILSTTATDSSPVGTYPITVSGAVATNYTISYNGGTLTVVGVPQITNTKVSGNQFIFSFPTLLHQNYQVEFKTDLHAPTWTNSGGLIGGTGNSITVTNAITGTALFYRVEVSPGN